MTDDRTLLNPPPITDLLAELAAFRERVAELAEDVGRDWSWSPAPGEWSLTEVACHLRDVEREVHQARLRALLEDDDAFLPGVDADEWAEARAYRLQNGRRAAADFVAARDETIALLAPLPEAVWERQGQHTFFGPMSLHELVYLAVQHDRVHGRQMDELTTDFHGLNG